jgi:hypothetical protein
MPRAPQYGEQRVQSTALPGVRRRSAETFASSGGGIGDAMEGFGHELQRAGGQLYGMILQEEAQRAAAADELQARKALNQLDHLMLQSQDRGLLHKVGMEPMELRAKYQEEYDLQASEIGKNVKTAAGQAFFSEELERRRSDFRDRVDTHASNEARAFHTTELSAYLESSTQRAMAAFDPNDAASPLRVRQILDEQAAEIDKNATYLRIGPEQAAAMKAKQTSDAHVSIVNKLVASGKDGDAQHYFDMTEQQIAEGGAKTALLERLRRGSSDSTGFAAANEIWAKFLPDESDDKAPIPLDKMEREARERFKDNPDAFKATISYIRDRRQGLDAARRDRTASVNDTLWGMAAKPGATLRSVTSTPDFKLAPGDVQNRIVDHFRAEADRAESRAAARDARQVAALDREDRLREKQMFGTYLELTTPATLRGMKRGEILAKLPELGPTLTNRLVNEWEQLQKSDAVVRDVTLDTDLFNQVMSGAGKDYVYKTPGQMTEDEKAEKGAVMIAIKDEIARMQGAGGRQLTRDEKEKIAQSVVDRKVMVDGFLDYERIAAAVTADERGKAYLPLAQVPAPTLSKFLNVLRGRPSPTLQTRAPSDDELKRRYKAEIERAGAIAVLNGTDAEIVAILEGKGQ